MIEPNYQSSVEFLQKLSPEGPWNLVAIAVDEKGLDGKTFHPGQEDDVVKWLTRYATRNHYYTLNPILRDIDTKPSRKDIKELAFLHVDLDPRAREDVASEQARILKLCEAMGTKPTCLVFSGGGYQALWKLEDPLPINGQEEAFEDAKLYNLQLEIIHDADHCHNVDRILRLPGTANHPDKKKREKGRTPQLAKVIWFNDVSYSLDQFTKAPQVQSADTGFSGHTVQVDGNVQRLESLDSLSVGPLCRTVIAMGQDPDEPGRWNSRSEPLWWVICEMVREGIDDQTIYAIVTDPDWSISGHVLDQPRPHDYAVRQIERAKDEAIDPILCELNDRHAVVQIGGAVKILREDSIPIGKGEFRPVINYMTFADFNNYYANRFITMTSAGSENTVDIPVGKWWVCNKHRRTYEGVVFVPGKDVDGYYNLWKGFGYEARPGNCEPFLGHIRDNICQGNEEWYDYLVGWMACLIQHPDQPGEVAVVFRGKPGTGKGFFFNQFGKLLGRHYLPVRDSNHVFGRFTQHLQECVFLFLDECIWAGNKKQEGMLKSLITEDTVLVEGKGTNAQVMMNFIHLGMASNEDWVVPVGNFDRRFFVLDVGDEQRRNREYFGDIVKEMEAGGYEALLHYLLSYDLSEFDVTQVPSTEAHKEQKMFTLSAIQEWWFGKLQDGRIYEGDNDWPRNVWASELQNDFSDHLSRWSRGQSAGNPSTLGRFLAKILPSGYAKSQASGVHTLRQDNGESKQTNRPYFYPLPSLKEARAQWDATFGDAQWISPMQLVDLGEHEETNF